MLELPSVIEERLGEPALGIRASELSSDRPSRTSLALGLSAREVVRRTVGGGRSEPAPRLDLHTGPTAGALADEVQLAVQRANTLTEAAPPAPFQLPSNEVLGVPTEVEL